MARFLFVVPPFVGHVNPTIDVGRELQARGHEVAWAGHPGVVRPLLPGGATLFALDPGVSDEVIERRRTARGFSALKLLWEDVLLPLARAMLPGVERIIERFCPDVVVVDQHALGGALAARRRALRWATLATTSAGLIDPFEGLPRVRAWLAGLFVELQREAGLPPASEPDRSPELVIAFTIAELVGGAGHFPAHYHFVGPSIQGRPEPVPFPWEALARGPRVLVSLGTVNADIGDRFYRTVVEALGHPDPAELQVVLVAPEGFVRAAPPNFLVRSYVPQLALLPHVSAVVCHAGHNTVCEALAHGLPLVVLPIKDDQPMIARESERAGAGIRLRFARARSDELRAAVTQVLTGPSYREAAAHLRRSSSAAGGAPRAAALLEGLLP